MAQSPAGLLSNFDQGQRMLVRLLKSFHASAVRSPTFAAPVLDAMAARIAIVISRVDIDGTR
jgi:hypothetical protein